ncbi:MAG: phosphoribosylformylglycinamidine synthase subunit PurS [Chitinophagaceae bacterium]|nr:phosphoribosylformylglycinamidine synthase subunit PurS [Chitinophagaceae bacterium]
MTFTAHITVMPLKELLDPQGKAVNESLHNLSITAIQDVRIGKHITLSISAESKEHAYQIAESACQKMLYNAVMESYAIVITEA